MAEGLMAVTPGALVWSLKLWCTFLAIRGKGRERKSGKERKEGGKDDG